MNHSSFDIKDRVIILTGGAGFLGQQYIDALHSAGARVIVWDNRKRQSNKAHFDLVDITNESAVQSATDGVVKEFGRIDVLINNAGMNPAVGSPEAEQQFTPYEKYSVDLWRKELEVNLTGMFICIKAVAPVMMKQRSGSIVNVASELSVVAYDHRIYAPGRRKSPAYITTKSGVVGITRSWASHLGEYGVRVNAVSWGGMQTKNHPEEFVKKYSHLNMLGRMAQVGEYNGVIIFLCSDASSFMTGHNLVVDGGKTAW